MSRAAYRGNGIALAQKDLPFGGVNFIFTVIEAVELLSMVDEAKEEQSLSVVKLFRYHSLPLSTLLQSWRGMS
jgi:hypothetical protein